MEIRLSQLIGPAFSESHRAVKDGALEIVESGGRGSGKSSYLSIEFLLQLIRHPDCHGAVLRKVGATLRTSTYAQLKWAAEALGRVSSLRPGAAAAEAPKPARLASPSAGDGAGYVTYD